MRTVKFLLLGLLPLLLSQCATTTGGGQDSSTSNSPGEYILLVGGPSLRSWEDLRRPGEQHDRFWGNFVAASNRRADQLKATGQLRGRQLTYLVYRPSLALRAREDGNPYLQWTQDNATKRGARLVFVDSADAVIHYINSGQPRGSTPIVGLEYFGHSNRYCLMLDYSADVYSSSTAYIHEVDLKRINRRAFADEAFVKSWGCHTGESMSAVFRSFTGQPMVGAIGTTDYTSLSRGEMPYAPRWTR